MQKLRRWGLRKINEDRQHHITQLHIRATKNQFIITIDECPATNHEQPPTKLLQPRPPKDHPITCWPKAEAYPPWKSIWKRSSGRSRLAIHQSISTLKGNQSHCITAVHSIFKYHYDLYMQGLKHSYPLPTLFFYHVATTPLCIPPHSLSPCRVSGLVTLSPTLSAPLLLCLCALKTNCRHPRPTSWASPGCCVNPCSWSHLWGLLCHLPHSLPQCYQPSPLLQPIRHCCPRIGPDSHQWSNMAHKPLNGRMAQSSSGWAGPA